LFTEQDSHRKVFNYGVSVRNNGAAICTVSLNSAQLYTEHYTDKGRAAIGARQ